MWVPGLVHAGQVRQLAETAWPGASAEVRPGPAPALPAGVTVEGGELSASGGRDWLPLRTKHQADPLREVLGHGLYVGAGDLLMVQVAARPASPSRQARARAGASGRRAGSASGAGGLLAEALRKLVLGVLDLVTELMRAGQSAPSQRTPCGPQAPERQDPFSQARQRAAVRKLTGPPLWEVTVRYTAATTRTGEAARQRVMAHRDALSAAFGAFTGELELADCPVRDPARVLAARPLRRGFLADTKELAALAHMPYEPGTVPGLRPSGARPVPPPPGIRRVPGSGQ